MFEWYSEPIASLVAEIKPMAYTTIKVVLIDLKDSWLGDINLLAVGKIYIGAIVCY
jgi:hypothetical protein